MAPNRTKRKKKQLVSKNIPSSTIGVSKQKKSRSLRSFYGWAALAFFVLSFILYGKSMSYGYILDDQMVITKNTYVQRGLEGLPDIFGNDSFLGYFQTKEKLFLLQGGRYRPLSLATFAGEVSVFGPDRPAISHFINIVLYALTGFMLFRVFVQFSIRTILPNGLFTLPFIAAMVWLLHPVHIESVANIKGRDELLALIFSLAALSAAIKYCENKKIFLSILSGLFLLMGMLAKENALTFIGIIPLSLWVFRKVSLSSIVTTSIPLIIAAFLFIIIRYAALGYFLDHGKAVTNLINDPFLEMDTGEKYATIMYTLGWYIKLLFIPYPLTHDYNPYHVPIMHGADTGVILSFVFYAVLTAWAAYKIRNRSIYAYGILFFLISLSIVSNILVSVGTFMNERFLYTPSVAFALIVGYFLVSSLPSLIRNPAIYKAVFGTTAIGLAGFFLWITMNRVPDWQNSLSLDKAAIKVSKNSARANCFFGVSLYQNRYTGLKDTVEKRKLLDSMEYYINRAITIYPMYVDALHMKTVILTVRYETNHNIDSLLRGFEDVTKKIPDYPPARDNIISYARYLFSVDPKKAADFCYWAGYEFYFRQKKNINNALLFLQLCVDANYNDSKILSGAAVVYEASGDKNKANEIRKAIR